MNFNTVTVFFGLLFYPSFSMPNMLIEQFHQDILKSVFKNDHSYTKLMIRSAITDEHLVDWLMYTKNMTQEDLELNYKEFLEFKIRRYNIFLALNIKVQKDLLEELFGITDIRLIKIIVDECILELAGKVKKDGLSPEQRMLRKFCPSLADKQIPENKPLEETKPKKSEPFVSLVDAIKQERKERAQTKK